MTRRLAAATLLAGTLGMLATSAAATHDDARACIGGDASVPGRMVGYCLDEDPMMQLRDILPL